MKVKIGNKIYDSSKQPIMLILDDEEKMLIGSMQKSDKKFCSYPQTNYWIRNNFENVKKFMDEYNEISENQ